MSDIYLSITETPAVVTLSQAVISGAVAGTVTVANTVTVALDANSLSALENVTVTVGSAVSVSGTVTVGNSVTIGSIPAISGTVTANVENGTILFVESIRDGDGNTFGLDRTFPISGTVTANVFGTVTVGNSVTISSLPAISGTVTANLSSSNLNSITIGVRGTVTAGISSIPVTSVTYVQTPNANFIATDRTLAVFGGVDVAGSRWGPIPLSDNGAAVIATGSVEATQPLYPFTNTPRPYVVTVGNSITISSLPSISGTVTANNPSGSLTTRFGSVTTANTPMLTAAVTNSARRYLLCQNLDPSVTVTIGIGFTPTTTQGIQLAAGGGIIMDSFVSTGAVWWLSSSAGSNFSILEG